MKGKFWNLQKKVKKDELEYDSRYISILIFIENKEQRSADRLYGSFAIYWYNPHFQFRKRERERVRMSGEERESVAAA